MIVRIRHTVTIGAFFLSVAAQADSNNALPQDHVVVKGETCASLALRFYGNRSMSELIHKANPSMGPSPHSLTAGRVLHLPVAVTALTGPDARVGALRNRVEVQAPDPRPAKREDPLYRGNKVSTAEQSSAQVVFRDETELRLGDETLVIILGDAKRAASRLSGETMVVSGTARARLSELAGPTPITGGTATVMPTKGGEVQVTVDASRTARVGVYKGSSKVGAQGKSVEVPANFGSKVVAGSKPGAPKPLPLAPLWNLKPAKVISTATVAVLDASYVQSQATRFHLEVATDSNFAERLVDTKVPANTLTVHVENLAPGDYFLRVSAFDDDGFESFYSPPLHVQVVHVDPPAPPPAPTPPPPPVETPRPVAVVPPPPVQKSPNVDVALRAEVPFKTSALLLGPSVAGHLRFGGTREESASGSIGLRAYYTMSVGNPTNCVDLLLTNGGDVCSTRSRTEAGIAIPVSYMPGVSWSWKPLFTLAPGISTTRNVERGETRERSRGTNNNFDIAASAGLLSPWGLLIDVGYRQSIELITTGATTQPSGFVGHVGWRF